MKTLISTITLSAVLLAPAAAFAATTVAQTTAPDTTPAAATQNTEQARVAMVKNQRADAGYGKQANDDRQGLARVQEQTRQLGATN